MTADRPATEPRTHGPDDGCGDLLWEHMSAVPGFDEEVRQGRADIAAGRCCPWSEVKREAVAAQGAAPRAEAEALLDRIMDEWDRDEAIAGIAAALAAPRAEGLDVEKIVRATLLFIDQTTPLSVGEPLIQKAIRYATNLSRLTSKEERP